MQKWFTESERIGTRGQNPLSLSACIQAYGSVFYLSVSSFRSLRRQRRWELAKRWTIRSIRQSFFGCLIIIFSWMFCFYPPFCLCRRELASLRRTGNPQNEIEMIINNTTRTRSSNQRVSVTAGARWYVSEIWETDLSFLIFWSLIHHLQVWALLL